MKLFVLPIVLLAVQVTALAQSNSKCSDMAKFRSPGVTLDITRFDIVPAGRAPGARGGPAGRALPVHCRIDGMMDRRTGTEGKTYGIRFAIALMLHRKVRMDDLYPAERSPMEIAAQSAVQQDIDAEAARVNSNPTAIIGDSWTWTNLSSFSSHGGKVIFYHGVSDPWFSAKDIIEYYQRMTVANGGEAKVKVKDWSRLFLSPGMGHCSGGSATLDTSDFLSAAVNWVEKNSPPESVTATGLVFPGRSRPLCPYPRHAQYNGNGNPEDAANFSCRN